MRILSIIFAALAAVVAAPSVVSAQCPTGTVLGCGSDLAGTLADGMGTIDYYECGTPTPMADEAGPEAVYTFTCPRAGLATVNVTGLNCDLDVFVLDGMCDASSSSDCVAGSDGSDLADESINIGCTTAGEVATIIVEGYGYRPGAGMDRCPRSGATYRIAIAPDTVACTMPGCAGCASGTSCVGGDSVSACGTGGAACVDCDDGNVCTTDACSAGACTHTPAGAGGTCDDGAYCTVDDTCTASGECTGGARDCGATMCDEATDSCGTPTEDGGTPDAGSDASTPDASGDAGRDASRDGGGDAGRDGGGDGAAADGGRRDGMGGDDDDDDDGGAVKGGGCDCRTGGGRGDAAVWLLGMLALVLARRRRR